MGLAGDAGIENPDALVVADAIGTQRIANSNETIEQYCTRCHSEQRQRGGLVLRRFRCGGYDESRRHHGK